MPGLNVEVGRHEDYSFEDEYDGNKFGVRGPLHRDSPAIAPGPERMAP